MPNENTARPAALQERDANTAAPSQAPIEHGLSFITNLSVGITLTQVRFVSNEGQGTRQEGFQGKVGINSNHGFDQEGQRQSPFGSGSVAHLS